jgi:hypothetical protein
MPFSFDIRLARDWSEAKAVLATGRCLPVPCVMVTHFARITVALVVTFAITLPLSRTLAELPSPDDVVPQCHKVFSEVGLIVHASASSKSRRIGSLEKGAKVRLAGERQEGGTVRPELTKQSDGSYWVKIKSPIAGWVLFAVQNDPNYRYLVPCD